tara:strand:+ start:603 stop:1355 length:753 start_codon:yes stop_codon:yes gene_type:complete
MPKTASVTSSLTRGLTQDLFKTSSSTILDSLGITPELAVSMTRKLVGSYSGDFYAESGGFATTVYDQSGNSRNLTNPATGDDPELTGSGKTTRGIFSSTSNTNLSTGITGSSWPSGNHDVFIVLDPVYAGTSSDKQAIFGRGSGDVIRMDDGSGSSAIAGMTVGEIRVNDTILPATVTRTALWAALTVSGLNVLSLEDVDLQSIGGQIKLGGSDANWRLECHFAEWIITPALSDADHTAIVSDIRDYYST